MLNKSIQQQQFTPNKPKKSHKIKVSLLILVIPILLVIGYFVVRNVAVANDRAVIVQYLEDKYDKEFVVDNIRSNAVGLGMPGQSIGVAYAIDEPTLTFEAGWDKGADSFFDEYVGTVWEKEEKVVVESFLATVYSDSANPIFDLTLKQADSTPRNDIVSGRIVPSFNQALPLYKENFYYRLAVNQTVDHELSPTEIEEHTSKLRQIINFVALKNVSDPSVKYAINIDGQEAGYSCSLFREELTEDAAIAGCITKIHMKTW